MYFLSNFQICKAVLLNIVILLYVYIPRLIYLLTRGLHLLTSSTRFVHTSSPPPASGSLLSVLRIYEFRFFCVCVFAFVCLLRFSIWVRSYSILSFSGLTYFTQHNTPKGPSMSLQMARLPSFFPAEWYPVAFIHIRFIYTSTDGHSGCLRVLACWE